MTVSAYLFAKTAEHRSFLTAIVGMIFLIAWQQWAVVFVWTLVVGKEDRFVASWSKTVSSSESVAGCVCRTGPKLIVIFLGVFLIFISFLWFSLLFICFFLFYFF